MEQDDRCLGVLRAVLEALRKLEFEFDIDKRASIRAALRQRVERLIAEIEDGRHRM